MAKVKYVGPAGLVKHDDRALKVGEVLDIHDDAFDGYMSLGAGKGPDGKDVPGHFECVEAPAPKTPTTEPAAAGDGKE